MTYKFFEIERKNTTTFVFMNSPQNRNLMSWAFWEELPRLMKELGEDESTRVVVLAARGKSFSLGLDIPDMAEKFEFLQKSDSAEDRGRLRKLILQLQHSINSVADCPKPVIAAVQKHCFGGGLDLVSACDLRLCTTDVQFSLYEVNVAIVADVGSLQRLPAIVGEGNLKEMAYTGKMIKSQRAYDMGLVNEVFPDYDALLKGAEKWASEIASHSPFVVSGVKHVLEASRGLSLSESLNYVATYNSAFLQSVDFFDVMKKVKERNK